MATIGEMVQRIKDRTPPPNPDGGIGGLTDEELKPWTDLLNGPDRLCECGETPGSCCSPILPPKGLP